MKYLLIIISTLFIGQLSAQVDADPDKEGMQYQYNDVTYDEATTLDEVVYNHHSIPINCPANKFRRFKRQQDRVKRKYYGDRWIDRVGDSMSSLGRGVGRLAVYIGAGVVVTLIVSAILKSSQKAI